MKAIDTAFFHKLYGTKRTRIFYGERDFLDYSLMILLTALVVGFAYGFGHGMAIAGIVLCAFMLVTFVMRHGVEFTIPVLLRRPQDVLYMFAYKLRNLTPMYFIALGLLLLENVLIAATPSLPHHVELMRNVGLTLFYIHLLSITVFRTAILIDHLAKKELVREVLMQTPWKRVIDEKTNITLEIVHAYCTGLLTHIVLIAPWYLVIAYSRFSVIFLPIMCLINVVVHLKWARALNAWFYRDHWLGHNSELEFLFLHGTHHDAIPSGMIAVAGNGFLEGFFRNTIGFPVPFYNPVISAMAYTFEIKNDIDLHQYIPGIFPNMRKRTLEIGQHSTHHYGRLEPYGFGLKLDQPRFSEAYKRNFARIPDELMNSLRLDEELTGFQWDNATHQNTLRLWEKYQKRRGDGVSLVPEHGECHDEK
jgi:hypothetical protein